MQRSHKRPRLTENTTTVKVTYDGTPTFNNIEGTSLRLARKFKCHSNAGLQAEDYFALDNGVWFVGNTPNGPVERCQ